MKNRSLTVLFALLLLTVFVASATADDHPRTKSAKSADISRGIMLDIPDHATQRQFGELAGSALTKDDSAALASFRFDADTIKALVVLVHWGDRPGLYPHATFDSMLFSRGVYPSGSVADYFDEISYGNAVVVGDVIDWYDAGTYDPDYWFGDLFWDLDPIVDFSQYDGNGDGDVDAVVFVRSGTGEEDTGDPIDIWSYAMKYPLNQGPGPFDGVYCSAWNTSPELRPLRFPEWPVQFSGEDSLNQIRVFCHEFTHCLGMPDLYDYDAKLDTTTYFTPNDDNDHPFVDWCVMGYGGYGIFSIKSSVSSHLSGYLKMQIGWLEPDTLIGEYHDLVLYDIETHPDSSLYLVPINAAEGEYFLLEYRNPHSSGTFDKLDSDFSCYFWPDLTFGGDSLDQGLLVSHAHDSLGAYWWRMNAGTPDWPHYQVAVVDAGYDPSTDYTNNPGGTFSDSAQWWYPYETRLGATFNPNVPGQNILSPTTSPSSDGYFGPSDITIRVDSIVGDRLYLYVNNPFGDADQDGVPEDGDGSGTAGDSPCTGGATTDCDDNCPGMANPDQADEDGDGVGDICDRCHGHNDLDDFDADGMPDSCDNCPVDFNIDQTDEDADGVGDICDNCPSDFNPDQADGDEDGIGDVCDGCCISPIRGDVEANGLPGEIGVDISDLVALVDYMFATGGPAPPCMDEIDIDGAGTIPGDIADLVHLVNYMFAGGPPPADCP